MSNDITALIAKLGEYIPNGDGHDSEFAHTLQSAIEALSSLPEGEAVAFLEGGTRYKVAVHEQAGTGIYGLPLHLNGQWVALVAAEDDKHLRLVAPSAAAEGVPDADEETYQMGKRDGYEEAVQEIDLKTGGDGEYRYCMDGDPDRHTPDAPAMISRIVERFNEKEAASAATIGSLAKALKALSFAAQITGGTAGRDDSLRAAIDQAEDAMSLGGIGEAVNRALDMEAELARLRTQSPDHSEHSLAMVGAQAGAVPAREYTDGRWHHGNGYLCMGTLRVARADFDTNPPEEFQTAFFEEMCAVLNTKTTAAPIVDANKGGVPEGWAVREGISAGTYTLVHPSGIKFTFGHDGSMYAGAVADFLKAMLSAAPSAPVAADERVRELEDIAQQVASNEGHHQVCSSNQLFGVCDCGHNAALAALAARKADGRPSNCRNRQRDEGKPYPKSGCESCKTGGMTGCPHERKAGGNDNAARAAYAKYCDESGIHSNRFPGWNELSEPDKAEWRIKADGKEAQG